MRYRFLIILLSTAVLIGGPLFRTVVQAQEMDIEVTVNKSQISGSSISFLNELANQIETYVNDYDWTEDQYQEKEQIQANFSIALRNYNSDNSSFTATLVINSTRPIYNTTQNTQLIQIKDNSWQFTYREGTNLTHDLLEFSPLESVIDYYVYILLGFDYDSFGALSGGSHFSQAQSIVDLAQTAGGSGWSRSSSNNRNRYFLVNDLLSTGYQEFRRAIYRYHRHGLDKFINEPQQARKEVLQALRMIQESKRNTTNQYLFDLFFSTKYDELVAIFDEADTQVRLQAYNLLTEIDPGHTSAYGKLQ